MRERPVGASVTEREKKDSQTQEKSEAGDVFVPLGPEQLHVDVLDGHRVVAQIHFL